MSICNSTGWGIMSKCVLIGIYIFLLLLPFIYTLAEYPCRVHPPKLAEVKDAPLHFRLTSQATELPK